VVSYTSAKQANTVVHFHFFLQAKVTLMSTFKTETKMIKKYYLFIV